MSHENILHNLMEMSDEYLSESAIGNDPRPLCVAWPLEEDKYYAEVVSYTMYMEYKDENNEKRLQPLTGGVARVTVNMNRHKPGKVIFDKNAIMSNCARYEWESKLYVQDFALAKVKL